MFTDPHGRRFIYLRLSVTDVCNFRCSYCLPNGYQRDKNAAPPLRRSELARIVGAFAAEGVTKVRLTGGEPSLRKDLTEIIHQTRHTHGIKTVAITTNGYQLDQRINAWHQAGLNALNVSVDSLNPRLFQTITGHNRLDEILAGTQRALELGIPVKMNAVLLRGINHTQLPAYLEFVKHHPVTIRFIELMQTGDNREYFKAHHLAGESIRKHLLRQNWALQHKHKTAGPADEYAHPGYRGKIGLVTPYAKDFCTSCNRLRVSSQGNLHLCLFASEGHSLRHLLQRDHQHAELRARIKTLLYGKHATHFLHLGDSGAIRNLAMLGG